MEENKPITIKEFIYYLVRLYFFLKKRVLYLALFCICGALLGLYYAWKTKPKYEAAISFVLTTGSNGSGLSGLASQFGLDIGLGGGDIFSEDNIVSLITSEKMIRSALFSSSSQNGKILINIYCEDLRLDKFWAKKLSYYNDFFPFPSSISKLKPIQDSLVREVCAMIKKNNLIVSKPDKKQNIFVAEVSSVGEQFAFDFVNQIVNATSHFYISTKTATSSRNLKMIEHEADSLRILINDGIVKTASEVDKTFNINPSKQVSRTGLQKYQLNLNVLSAAYGEVLKNLEIARITLQRETPLYQIIDAPKLPLIKVKKNKLLFLIGGGILSLFLGCFFLIFLQIIKKTFKKYE